MGMMLGLMIMTLVEVLILVLLLLKVNSVNLKKLKPEQWVIFSIYFIVFCVIGYFVLSTYAPSLMSPVNSGEYVIDGSALNGALKSFYFEKEILGEAVEIGSEEYYPLTSEEINNIIFEPKKIIQETSGTLEIEGVNQETELYLNDKLVIPNLENYVKVGEVENSEIYTRKDYSYSSLTNYEKLEDYLYYNFPQAEVYSFTSLDDSIPVLMDYKMEDTKIKGPFRDNLNLVVYHGGGILKINLEKQDLNSYIGKDEYTMTIKDLNGKEVYSKVLKDDGESKDTKELGEEQDFSISVNLEKGIYYIEFVKDKNNDSADSTLKEIKINSNKILIKGKFLPWSEKQKFFTKVLDTKEIKFNYWWNGKDQKIYFTGDKSFTFKLDEEDKEKWTNKELEKGNYYFKIEKGFLWIDLDYTSITEENWFNIPTESEDKMFNPDVLVIDKDTLEIKGEKFYLNFDLNIKSEDKIKFQVLDADKLFIKQIKLSI